ncbi:MAG TPA: hypothetical protein VNX68_17880 [Nitrosopumilaceae archaeon]|jgi:hypothetical protein|nr:hypothetical protein [Nitrosopumilaceae archaeon]
MSTSVKEIAWVAGILEGEGYFGLSRLNGAISIQLTMTDLDIVERIRSTMKITTQIYMANRGGNNKSQYRLAVSTNLVIQWMMTIYPLMGLRRKARIRELLHHWKTVVSQKERAKQRLLGEIMGFGLTKEEANLKLESMMKGNTNGSD